MLSTWQPVNNANNLFEAFRTADLSNHRNHITAEIAGLTGLAEGTPAVGGLFDISASILSAGIVEKKISLVLLVLVNSTSLRKMLLMIGHFHAALAMGCLDTSPTWRKFYFCFYSRMVCVLSLWNVQKTYMQLMERW